MNPKELDLHENAFAICVDGVSKGVFVAHCPASNMNLTSGIAPIRKCLDLGLNVGLCSDIAG